MRTRWLPAGVVGRVRPSAIHSATPDVWFRQGSGLALSGSAFCSSWSFPLQSSLQPTPASTLHRLAPELRESDAMCTLALAGGGSAS
eukprot:9397499-Pyramimonas_sp.AAC.1